MQEGPDQIMNMLFEEQTYKIIFKKLSNSNDFEDWMKCVVKYENKRNEMFKGNKFRKCLVVF
jgi:hypothetical protein